MSMKILSNLGLLLGLSVLTTAYCYTFPEEWKLWKSTHKKSYISEKHELERHTIWLANQQYIDAHNANEDVFGFTLAMNQFGDMTDAEFLDYHSCYEQRKSKETRNFFHASSYEAYPIEIDWRSKDAVSSVKDQGQCGCCYAFSAVGALEGVAALARDKMIPLSEQNVVDCSVPYGNHGCNGGNMHDVYQYIITNEGIDTAESYPYKAKQGVCIYQKNSSVASMSGVISIPAGSEKDLLGAVGSVGPVSVAVDGSTNAFRFYAGGVFDSHQCSSSKLTHSMLITGYGEYNGRKYWLVKNSWGTRWGINGYIMMSRDRFNQCGIASDASYPTL